MGITVRDVGAQPGSSGLAGVSTRVGLASVASFVATL